MTIRAIYIARKSFLFFCALFCLIAYGSSVYSRPSVVRWSDVEDVAVTPPDQAVGDFICHLFTSNFTYRFEDHFSEGFQTSVSQSDFQSTIAETVKDAGRCVSWNISTFSSDQFKIELSTDEAAVINVAFSLDREKRELLSGFFLLGASYPMVRVSSFSELRAQLARLPGVTSVTLERFGVEKRSVRGDEIQPIASSFKLFVLSSVERAVRRGLLQWTQEFPLREDWKSFPSGLMQMRPAGERISLLEYATEMIRISDNTASDHLIHILGRETIEDEMATVGEIDPALNSPLMTTSEVFKLKWGVSLEDRARYVSFASAEKKKFLNETLAHFPLENVRPKESPVAIQSLEWFASTESLCRVMRSLRERSSETVLSILSRNAPLVNRLGPWAYAGFKGGSEPGVLNMTYLLKNRSGQWACASFAWRNESGRVNQALLSDIVAKTLSSTWADRPDDF